MPGHLGPDGARPRPDSLIVVGASARIATVVRFGLKALIPVPDQSTISGFAAATAPATSNIASYRRTARAKRSSATSAPVKPR
jgi:hypothetical protein